MTGRALYELWVDAYHLKGKEHIYAPKQNAAALLQQGTQLGSHYGRGTKEWRHKLKPPAWPFVSLTEREVWTELAKHVNKKTGR